MRWRPWLIISLSLILACATARPPVLTLAMDSSFRGLKKHIELKDRSFAVTIVSIGRDGKPATSTREGVLPKEAFAEVLRILDGIRLADLQDAYMDKHLSIINVSTLLVHIDYKGQKKGIFLLGDAAPKELVPLMDLVLPLMYT